ncbi:Importin N-terminal domain-containing protein [Psidium guajava]|nr:Importin N-terminal domain-containing protein [Psidium guajava]
MGEYRLCPEPMDKCDDSNAILFVAQCYHHHLVLDGGVRCMSSFLQNNKDAKDVEANFGADGMIFWWSVANKTDKDDKDKYNRGMSPRQQCHNLDVRLIDYQDN